VVDLVVGERHWVRRGSNQSSFAGHRTVPYYSVVNHRKAPCPQHLELTSEDPRQPTSALSRIDVTTDDARGGGLMVLQRATTTRRK